MDTGVSLTPLRARREGRPVKLSRSLVVAAATGLLVLGLMSLQAVFVTAHADPVVQKCRAQWGGNQQRFRHCVVAHRCQARWHGNRQRFFHCVCQAWWGQNQQRVAHCIQQYRQRDRQLQQLRKQIGN